MACEQANERAEIIPASERRTSLTMGLLWITMTTFFPGVLVGFLWYKQGLSLSQVLICTTLSCLLMLAYAFPSGHLGALSGHSYGTLIRSVFGKLGNKIVSVNLVWVFIAWYGLCSLFLAENLQGIFHFDVPLVYLAPFLAFAMAFNNFWGFKGVANFARFFAAPLIILWVVYTLIKATGSCPASVWTEAGSCSFPAALTLVANFVIGVCVWGNEADYWRYGKPQKLNTLLPIAFALFVGQMVFPATGWLVARMSGITDYAKATSFMTDYSFGGIAILGGLVLSASYFAANDSNLYGSTNALSHLVNLPHRVGVTLLTIFGAMVAVSLSAIGCAESLEKVASLNCVVLAMPTVIVCTEYFIVHKLLGISLDFTKVTPDENLPTLRRSAIVALVVGCVVGIATAGVLPGFEALHLGICSLQGWLAGMAVYIPLRLLEERSDVVREAIPVDCRVECESDAARTSS